MTEALHGGSDDGSAAMTEDAFDHDRAAALLPWIANGTLEGEERKRVERHVKTCLSCRADLAEQMRLRTLVQRLPVVHLSADAGFERLRGRLDQEPARRFDAPRRALWALAAAVAIAGVGWSIAVGLLGSDPFADPRFETLSDGADGVDERGLSNAADDGVLIDVIFADGVRESQMRELLDSLGAEIVAGPSRALGRYTLRIPPASVAPPDVDAIVQRLLDDERIRFAGRTFSLPASGPRSGEPATTGAPSNAAERAEHDR